MGLIKLKEERTFGEIYELALDYYKQYNKSVFFNFQPSINADLLRISTDSIPSFFINEVIVLRIWSF
jgi:hypothetical protein